MKKLNSLILEQKEDAKHGDSFFPIQKYITSLTPEYPVLTTHWHEEAEFTLITEGQGTYYIELMEYGVEPEDLVFVIRFPLSRSAPSWMAKRLFRTDLWLKATTNTSSITASLP